MKVEEVERWLAPILGYDAEEGVWMDQSVAAFRTDPLLPSLSEK